MLRAVALSLCFLVAATSAHAQAQARPQAQASAQQQPQSLSGQAWYRSQLVDLSYVLGGAHYLRILCQGRGDQRWRDYMRGVIDREPNYRDDLIANFNRGYREQEARFPTCDRTASQTEAELRARGLRISNGLSARASAPAHHE